VVGGHFRVVRGDVLGYMVAMAEPTTLPEQLARSLIGDGYAFVAAAQMRAALEAVGSLSDWARFAGSWEDLGLDRYMADGGRYRRRRHAAFAVEKGGALVRKPHQPHYQSRDYNPLNGGIARWFQPISDVIAGGASLQTILRLCQGLFGSLVPEIERWHVEVHQFRIEAASEQPGRPTPEGLHQDGVDFVFVLLVSRVNIQSGVTQVHALDRRLLGSFTLTDALDAALTDDNRVLHAVTAVQPLDPAKPAHRDVLVVTFRREAR
jgi:hypothetical protein